LSKGADATDSAPVVCTGSATGSARVDGMFCGVEEVRVVAAAVGSSRGVEIADAAEVAEFIAAVIALKGGGLGLRNCHM